MTGFYLKTLCTNIYRLERTNIFLEFHYYCAIFYFPFLEKPRVVALQPKVKSLQEELWEAEEGLLQNHKKESLSLTIQQATSKGNTFSIVLQSSLMNSWDKTNESQCVK